MTRQLRTLRTHRILGSALLAGLLAIGLPRTASAQEANGFGEKHELIVSVDRFVPLLSYSSQTLTNTQGGTTLKTTDSGTSLVFLFGREPSLGVVHTLPRVAFDFSIVNRLTLGGSFAFAIGLGGKHEENLGNNVSRTNDTPKTTIIGFAPRVGYVLPLSHAFAFWPRAGFAFYSVSSKVDGVGQGGATVTTSSSDSLLSLDLDPQFVVAPVRHFFFNFGPIINIPLTGSRSIDTTIGSNTNTTKNDLSVFHFGLTAGLGGWFDL
jgi:hypothetical protein